jgi:fumarate reductase flavoprotein subunit
MAIRLCAGITYTMGGIAIDAEARALSIDGTPIAGLYAAGSTTGGLDGGPDAVYLGGLARAATFGLRAGEAAAAQALI